MNPRCTFHFPQTSFRALHFSIAARNLDEKLKTAINLLNEVDAELCEEKEDYLEDFLYELKQGTHRLVTAIRGLDQDPIV